jgi:hypothetical protein
MRWMASIAATAWVATVLVIALVSDLRASVALLFALLGLLVVAALVLGLTLRKLLLRIERKLAATPAATKATTVAPPLSDADIERVEGVVDKQLRGTFARLEALQNLYAMLPIEHALPASRIYPASPELLLFLVDLVDRHRPKLIVECGSGRSTLCFALAMRQFGIDGKVIALEHLDEYAGQTEELLRRHDVADLAEVRYAPLEDFTFGDDTTPWYARSAWEDIQGTELLLVDGPPAKLGPLARYPAFPFFADRLASGAHIVLDDYERPEERAVLKRWSAENPGRLSVQRIVLEKGAALITVS